MAFKRHIPNFITALNLVCGALGVVAVFNGTPHYALYCMLAAAVFDFCDGLAARLLGAYSPMGKELDSLCDMVSFGLLPALLLYDNISVYASGAPSWLHYTPVLVAVGAALRLAKFNIDERQHDHFIGLATPVAALLCASLCYCVEYEPSAFIGALCGTAWFVPVLSLVLFLLMVSPVPMFSIKFGMHQTKAARIKRTSFLVQVLVVLAGTLLLGANWSFVILISCVLYIVENIIFLFPMRGAAALLALVACMVSCKEIRHVDKGAFDFTDPDGSIVVFGELHNVGAQARYMLECDDFDNVTGHARSDGLADFCGEVISKVIISPVPPVDSMVVRTVMDTVAFVPEGLDMIQVRKNRGKYFIFAQDTSLAECGRVAAECYRVMRQRNVFTHKISLPSSELYVAATDSEGKILIFDSND